MIYHGKKPVKILGWDRRHGFASVQYEDERVQPVRTESLRATRGDRELAHALLVAERQNQRLERRDGKE